MKATDRKASSTTLAEANPQAMARYKEMRAQVMPAAGLPPATSETVLAMQLALRGHEVPFKIHAMRAMAEGVTPAQLEALLMAGLGVTLIACEVARAVEWLREAHEESSQAARAA